MMEDIGNILISYCLTRDEAVLSDGQWPIVDLLAQVDKS